MESLEKFAKLAEIAKKVDCESTAEAAEKKARALMQQQRTHIAVVGTHNSGKSALINRMLGMEVAEEGLTPDEEGLPLRVCFEKTPDDERYHCVTVMNPVWYEQDAVLYELHERDILSDGALSEKLDDKDVVLFLISAAAPFNSNDVSLLQSLSSLHRQVILSGLHYVSEDSREKVVEYVQKINDSLGLPPVVTFENREEQEIGRIIRDLLPAYLDLQSLRVKHTEAMFVRAVSDTVAAMEAALRENDASIEKRKQEAANFISAAKRIQAAWDTLLTDTRQRQNKAANEVTANLSVEGRRTVAQMMEEGKRASFNDTWLQEAGERVLHIANDTFDQKIQALHTLYLKDLKKIAGNAAYLKLDEEENFRKLEAFAPVRASFTPGNFGVTSKGVSSDEMRIVIGTGIVIDAVILSPLSWPIKVVGVGAASTGGAGIAWKQHVSGRETAFTVELSEWYQSYVSSMEESLRKATQVCYSELLSYLQERKDSVHEQTVDLTPLQERASQLHIAMEECQKMS